MTEYNEVRSYRYYRILHIFNHSWMITNAMALDCMNRMGCCINVMVCIAEVFRQRNAGFKLRLLYFGKAIQAA